MTCDQVVPNPSLVSGSGRPRSGMAALQLSCQLTCGHDDSSMSEHRWGWWWLLTWDRRWWLLTWDHAVTLSHSSTSRPRWSGDSQPSLLLLLVAEGQHGAWAGGGSIDERRWALR